MFDLEDIVDLLIENLKKLFFPEEWIELDLKFSKFEIFAMLLLYKSSEVTMTELVEYINVPMSTATGIVDRLVKKGYIARERSEADRRIVVLKLTEEGSNLVKNLKDLICKYLNMILQDLTEEEKQSMAHIAMKIMNKLQRGLSFNDSAEQKNDIKKISIE
ncbi:MarR family winged helix-turn-helix transcriptional regulator [Lutispora saccharofermentans]|uniref:MarR family transcriptional regulator n=1 Tax=Lutispora saccharofermentans TaxID=3024236 RepID=A0ABT1NCP7_9FIRM|nr:MarR family transcriptional regulator [Lutispora saccharofermentans]MCQ1529037.1 MarR family transcriptional regulator [Lutispora saccharofermentans]